MGKCISDNCDECNGPENVEHIIMRCKKCNAEKRIMQDKKYELEQEWSLKGILGADEKMWECSKALFNFLKYTGLEASRGQ